MRNPRRGVQPLAVAAFVAVIVSACVGPAPDGVACAEYGEQLYTANPGPRIVEATRVHCRAGADAGDARSQYYFGSAYLFSDPAAAEEWMRRAAEGGHGSAQFYMATVYRTQRDRDMARAVDMYEKAAANGVPPASLELAAIYRNGIGMPADGERAVHWYEHAFSRFRLRDAADALAAIYRSGLPGVPPDERKVEFWTKQRDALKCPGTAGSIAVIC
jgi:TPR repeat protein